MSVANQDFDIDEGATRTISVPITLNGAPFLIPAGGVVTWWASPSQFDADTAVPIKKTVAAGNLVVTVSGGQSVVSVFLNPSDTIGRGQKKLFHQARLVQLDGVTVPLFSGTMTVIKRLVT